MARTILLIASATALVSSACALSPSSPAGAPDASAPDTGGSDSGGGGGNDAGAVVGIDSSSPPPDAPTITPFAVDQVFIPSGYMGDGETPGIIVMLPAKPTDNADCHGKRSSPSAAGQCHEVTYTPPATGKGWAGVYWQYPANNWGLKPGYALSQGATKVTFWAKGAAGGEQVTFLAGGIAGSGSPYQDTVKSQVKTTLTSDWVQYTIDITGQSYTQVIGGFGWTMTAATAATSGQFFVDGILWQ